MPNPELKLKPGMTANVTVEVTRRDNVLRVANAALRFRPTAEMFAVLNQAVPAELQRNRTAGARGPADPAAARTTAQPQVVPAVQRTVSNNTPAQPSSTVTGNATTIDALFAPLPATESRGMVWQYDANRHLQLLRLRLGATDGSYTEVLNDADVPADAAVVTAMRTGLEASAAPSPAPNSSPLLGGQRGGPGGRGGPAPGGRGF